jgi:hypothetical protein
MESHAQAWLSAFIAAFFWCESDDLQAGDKAFSAGDQGCQYLLNDPW